MNLIPGCARHRCHRRRANPWPWRPWRSGDGNSGGILSKGYLIHPNNLKLSPTDPLTDSQNDKNPGIYNISKRTDARFTRLGSWLCTRPLPESRLTSFYPSLLMLAPTGRRQETTKLCGPNTDLARRGRQIQKRHKIASNAPSGSTHCLH